MLNNVCKICYKSKNKNTLQIFDQNGIGLNIANIIKQHFWFKIIENDGQQNVICDECWIQIKTFHAFYNNVEFAHNVHFGHSKQQVRVKIEEEWIKNESVNINILHYDEKLIDTLLLKHDDDNDDDIIKSTNKETEFQIIPDCSLPYNDPNCDGDSIDQNNGDDDDKRSVNVDLNGEVGQTHSRRRYQKGTKRKRKDNILIKTIAIIEDDAFEKQLQIDRENIQIREYFKMECELCDFKFLNFLDAKAHYRQLHKCKGYITCCNRRKFYHRGHVLDHISRHLNPDAYKCEFCNRIYANKIALRNHMETHASAEQKPFECDLCPKRFLKRSHLNHHRKHRHCKEEDKTFACDICQKNFLTKSILTSHIRGVHENAYSQICDVCAKVFKTKKILQLHREIHFAGSSTPKLQCTICGVWLKHEQSLRAHLARHNDIKYNCPKCGKPASSRNALNNHLRYVHTERNFPCTLCTKAFKKPIALKEHVASHTGEVLYTCPYCTQTFSSGANMHSHRKKIHPIQWAEARGQRTASIHNIEVINNVQIDMAKEKLMAANVSGY